MQDAGALWTHRSWTVYLQTEELEEEVRSIFLDLVLLFIIVCDSLLRLGLSFCCYCYYHYYRHNY